MLSEDLITKIGNDLDAVPPKPASRLEIDQLVARIAASIQAAQERGLSYPEIAKRMTNSGYPITTSALRNAMQRRRKGTPRKRSAPRVARSAPPVTPATPATPVTPAIPTKAPAPAKDADKGAPLVS
jgi:hypothetical protein